MTEEGRVSRHASRLPGVVDLASNLIVTLRERPLVFLIAPQRAGSFDGIRDAFARHRDGTLLSELRASPGTLPATAVGTSLAWSPERVERLLALEVDGESLAESSRRVVWTSFPGRSSKHNLEEWKVFLTSWARAAKAVAGLPSIVIEIGNIDLHDELCCIDEPTVAILEQWGRVSVLDVRLACRFAGVGEDQTVRDWKEAIVPELAGADLALADAVWDAVTQPAQRIKQAILRYANLRWPVPDELHKALQVSARANHGGLTNRSERMHWLDGLFECTHEHGVEDCVAARLLLKLEDELLMRLWRGSALIILPLVDLIRRRVMDRLAEERGGNWRDKIPVPNADQAKSLETDLRSCDIGYLAYAINESPGRQKEWRALLSLATELRNDIAHNRLVEFESYRKLCRLFGDWRTLTSRP